MWNAWECPRLPNLFSVGNEPGKWAIFRYTTKNHRSLVYPRLDLQRDLICSTNLVWAEKEGNETRKILCPKVCYIIIPTYNPTLPSARLSIVVVQSLSEIPILARLIPPYTSKRPDGGGSPTDPPVWCVDCVVCVCVCVCGLVCFVYTCVQFECTLALLGCAILLECSGAFWFLGRANANVSPSACCPFDRIVELSLMKIIMIIISDGWWSINMAGGSFAPYPIAIIINSPPTNRHTPQVGICGWFNY